jgi:hypothetical protein
MIDINELLDKAITDWLSNEEKKLQARIIREREEEKK